VQREHRPDTALLVLHCAYARTFSTSQRGASSTSRRSEVDPRLRPAVDRPR
jgi:hypothetical protein